MLRDIFGNPFRPVAFAPAWRSPDAVGLAGAIYAERAFDRLPILADALEEAGCDNADVLAHLRGDGPHVRGCWVRRSGAGEVVGGTRFLASPVAGEGLSLRGTASQGRKSRPSPGHKARPPLPKGPRVNRSCPSPVQVCPLPERRRLPHPGSPAASTTFHTTTRSMRNRRPVRLTRMPW